MKEVIKLNENDAGDQFAGKVTDSPLLNVHNLSIGFYEKDMLKPVTQEVSFSLSQGEILGIVGESGSGKSVTALALMRLLSRDARIMKGSIEFDFKNLLSLTDTEYCKIRGNEMTMVFQEPMTSLNPVLTIGYQAEEVLKIHRSLRQEERKFNVLSMFEEVGLKDSEKLYHKYPHQLSGGMRQRVMIAIAMMLRPKLLIADEPTTALDVTLQTKLLHLLKRLNEEYGTSIILISHDLSVIRNTCTRALIMQKGRIVEQGLMVTLFQNPKDEYTKQLLNASMGNLIKEFKVEESNSENHVLLEVEKLNVYYTEKKEKLYGKSMKKKVVNQASLYLKAGEVLGIVGESGCGKSSMAKAIVGLIKDWNGQIRYPGHDAGILPQMVFQDPYGSLNPSKKIGWLLEEPLKIHSKLNKSTRKRKVIEMLNQVGLSEHYAKRYPKELSGGQRQRVAIAIALMLNQKLIILDEPVSALDVTIQEQILKLLLTLQKEQGLSYLFISHDLNVIRRICDRVCVMYKGEIVEMKTTAELFYHPAHEYTKKLLASIIQ